MGVVWETKASTHDLGVDSDVAQRPYGVPREGSIVATLMDYL